MLKILIFFSKNLYFGIDLNLFIQTSNMKRPGLIVAILLFISVFSTTMVSVVISGIAKSFQKEEIQSTKIQSGSIDNTNTLRNASVKL